MVGKTNVAGARLRSVIAVTYPAGSICTCTNGTRTLKARDTSGYALFNVTVGEWTVTARTEDGNKETNKTVSITDGGQCASVALFFEFVLYETGNEYTDITGGWYASDKYSSPTLSKNENNMTITLPIHADIAVAPKSAIDLTAYSTLKIRFSKLAYKPNGYQYWGLSQSATGFTIGTYSAVAKLETAVNNVVSCDIAEVTSAQFVKLVISGLTDGGGTITTVIEKIWAE